MQVEWRAEYLKTGSTDHSDDTFIVRNTGKRVIRNIEYISEL
ncbi:hypothetical protein HW555_006517, partial [Spodoptera exigua]